MKVSGELSGYFVCGATYGHIDAGCAKRFEAVASNKWIRIFNRAHDAFDASGDDRIDARRLIPVVAARLQRGVQRRATSAIARSGECIWFGVTPPVIGVGGTDTNDVAIGHYDSPDMRPRRRDSARTSSSIYCCCHRIVVAHRVAFVSDETQRARASRPNDANGRGHTTRACARVDLLIADSSESRPSPIRTFTVGSGITPDRAHPPRLR